MNKVFWRSLLAAVAVAVVGCSRQEGQTLDVGLVRARQRAERRAAMALPPRELSPEEQKVVRMNELLEGDRSKDALAAARDLMDSTNSVIRSEALTVLQWVGRAALPEITEMINDPDAGIAQEAQQAWECVFADIGKERVQADVIAECVCKLKRQEDISTMLLQFTTLEERFALPALAKIITANPTNLLGECAREMYEHVNGGTPFEDVKKERE